MNRIFNIISLLLLCTALFAQEVKPAKEATAKSDSTVLQSEATQANEKSLLWVISGNGLDKPSYLYGTIHMIGKEDFGVEPVEAVGGCFIPKTMRTRCKRIVKRSSINLQ